MKHPPVHYNDYLKIDQLLGCQKRRSEEFNAPAHDELLFIIVHQAYELWFKQILFELESIYEIFNQDKIPESSMGLALRRMHRVIEIQRLINGQIDVLETMTPLEFLEFREFLYPASGFQSFQFRKIETILGLKPEDRLKFNDSPFYKSLTADQQTDIQHWLKRDSLFDLINRWLARTPILKTSDFDFWSEYKKAVQVMLSDDKDTVVKNPRLGENEKTRSLQMIEETLKTFDALFSPEKYKELQAQKHFRLQYEALHAALLVQLYREQPLFQLPFEILQSFMDLDELMTQWRYRHSLMAHRMLGQKIGTGGSSGHQYLQQATEKHKIFTDFFNLSTFFIPKSKLPKLPESISRKLNYSE